MSLRWVCCLTSVLSVLSISARSVEADIYDLTIRGTDAIFLAGRTDVTIPPASQPWGILQRHSWVTPEELLETLPSSIAVSPGDVIRALDPAIGGVSFFQGFGGRFFGPNGSGGSSVLNPVGGISGYSGPVGALVGVFLDDSIPDTGPAPATLNFLGGLGTEFLSLSPQLRQVFYIGDGVNNNGSFQTFIAPAGARRLFFGIPDGLGFNGPPGYYDDNDGSYRILIGVNAIPAPVPEPTSLLMLGIGASSLLVYRRQRRSTVNV